MIFLPLFHPGHRPVEQLAADEGRGEVARRMDICIGQDHAAEGLPPHTGLLPAYVIGTLDAFWLVQRLASF